jgi:hypothetical protein
MATKGFGDLSKKLNQLADNARALGDTKSASLTEILTPQFMSSHTRYQTANEFFEASGFKVDSQADFEAIPEDKLDAFVRSASSFSSWRELLNTAGAAWAKKKLGF